MRQISERPSPDAGPRVDSLVDVLPRGDRIPRRSGDLAFDHAWEIRAFSIAMALHERLGFPWSDFQEELVTAIREWEAEHPDLTGWSYYERWTAALERLAERKGWLARADLDARAEDILASPASSDHQHAVREPVAVLIPGGRGHVR